MSRLRLPFEPKGGAKKPALHDRGPADVNPGYVPLSYWDGLEFPPRAKIIARITPPPIPAPMAPSSAPVSPHQQGNHPADHSQKAASRLAFSWIGGVSNRIRRNIGLAKPWAFFLVRAQPRTSLNMNVPLGIESQFDFSN